MTDIKFSEVRKNVAKTYGSIARTGGSCCNLSRIKNLVRE